MAVTLRTAPRRNAVTLLVMLARLTADRARIWAEVSGSPIASAAAAPRH